MKKSRAKVGKVTLKSLAQGQGGEKLSLSWPMEDLLSEVADEIEAFSAEIGLRIMQAMMEHEVSKKVGVGGRQKAYRHGAKGGYVVYGGRKVKIQRPRVRGKDGSEVNLESHRAFQGEGKMQAAVARRAIMPEPSMNVWRAMGSAQAVLVVSGRRPLKTNYKSSVSGPCPRAWWHCNWMGSK